VNGRKIIFLSNDDAYSPPKNRRAGAQAGWAGWRAAGRQPARDADQFGNLALHEAELRCRSCSFPLAPPNGTTPNTSHWTTGWQPNYQSEGRVYAAYIPEHKPDGKIGVLYQNDDFGKDYLNGLKDGLGDKAQSMIVVAAAYETTEPTVASQVIGMKAAGVDVFVNTAIPNFAIQAIRKAAMPLRYGRSSSVLAQIRIVRPRVAPAISRAGRRREAPVSAAKRVRSRHKRPAHEANAGPGFALRRPSGGRVRRA
jgi:branched-chain amino acid transport system substrate-binding protein